jgi:transcriptional regulator with XRE-family HTH domain
MDTDAGHLIAADVADTRAAARRQVAQELENVRRRRESAQLEAEAELDRLGALLPVAEDAGMRQHEIAELSGVSRQTLVNLRNRGRGADRHWNIDLRILLKLAFHGAHSVPMLESAIGFPVDAIETGDAIERLVQAKAIRFAGSVRSGQQDESYYRITQGGLAQLPGRLHHAAMPASIRWAAYIATKDADKLTNVGETALGQYEVALIPASTTHDMQLPEIAFYVDASTVDHAAHAATVKYAQLRKLAKLEPEPAYITTLIPPEIRARNRAA